jgi:rubrerythrin
VVYQKSWSDWWRQFLGLSPDGYREVLKILQDRYTDEMRHAQLYAQHAGKMQYPQFREKLLAIAADEARHAEWLADKIRLLGGKLPSVSGIAAAGRNSWQYLLADVDEEKHCSDELIEQMQTVRNEMPDVAKVLERIYEDGAKHRAEIRKMLMRSDPQAGLTG